MVFEPKFTKVISSTRKSLGTTQSVIEVKLPTNENDIRAIYTINAKSTILNSEMSGSAVNFTGLVDFQVVYESDNVSTVDYSAEFRDRFNSDKELYGELILDSNVIDVTSSVVSGGMKVVAIVETQVDLIESRDVNVLTDIQGESQVMNKDITISSYLGKASEKIDVTGDFVLKDASNVLMVSPTVCLSSVNPKENYMIVDGSVELDICYLTGENNNELKTQVYSIDFTNEVAFEGVTELSSVQSNIQLLSNEIKVSTTLEDSGANVNVYIPLTYNGYVFENKKISIIDDAYLPSNYLSITRESVNTLSDLSSIAFKDTVSGIAEILDTAPFIDEILCVTANNIIVATSRIDQNMFTLEGIANTTVVYYSKETESNTSVMVEMPFSIEQKVNGDDAKIVTVCLSNINARSKRGKEIEVSADLNVFADIYFENSDVVISEITVGDEKPKDDCSLFIYIVKPNQTIWDVAKEMNISQEILLDQNPDVQLPLRAGDRLVIYTPRVVEYM